MGKRVSSTRQEFMKERKRIMSFLNRLKKEENIYKIPEINLEIPKRVTKKKVEELKYWTAIRIRSNTYYKFLDLDENLDLSYFVETKFQTKKRKEKLKKEGLKKRKELERKRKEQDKNKKNIPYKKKSKDLPSYDEIIWKNIEEMYDEYPSEIKDFMDTFIQGMAERYPNSHKRIVMDLYDKGKLPTWENVSAWNMILISLKDMMDNINPNYRDKLNDLLDEYQFNFETVDEFE